MGSVSFAEVVAAVAAFDRKPKEPERHELSDAEWRLVEPLLPDQFLSLVDQLLGFRDGSRGAPGSPAEKGLRSTGRSTGPTF